MASRKRNEFLDLPSDDDEGTASGYDYEAAEESKGHARRRAAKRRRIDDIYDSDASEAAVNDDREDEISNSEVEHSGRARGRPEPSAQSAVEKAQDHREQKKKTQEEGHEDEEEGGKNDGENDVSRFASWSDDETNDTFPPARTDDTQRNSDVASESRKAPPLKVKPATKKNKFGVIYLSSLPPYLKPFALKSMLEARGFGPITRVFLTPAVPPASSSASGTSRPSNKRKTYTDGWVEFKSKKTAKICAETLNASIVGGRKGGWYHDDVWNMKYLKGFRWADLMEQVQRERSEREARRRIEDARARKEEKVFLAGVDKGRMLDGIKRKREEKERNSKNNGNSGSRRSSEDGANGDIYGADDANGIQVRRLFKQHQVKAAENTGQRDIALAEDTKRVLGKIF